MIRNAGLLTAIVLATSLSWADEAEMIRLGGTPEQVGTIWGEINKGIIRRDFDASYVKRAAAAGISREALIERSAAFVEIAEQIAPHWLDEARATARAVGVDEDLYVAYWDGASRSRFLDEEPEECTSYAVSRDHARDGAILFHKTRDNRDVAQAVCIVESSREGINKFICVSNATTIRCSMMVNDKGLAGSGDYPADRKKDSSTLRLEPAPPKFRGMMAGTILRHIAERASTCAEALAIIEDCVAKGWYSGGKVGGSHWLFVDREGTILEVCNNPRHVVSKIHTQKAYFSRLNKSEAARRLRESPEPVDFSLFRSVSRDRSICFGSSISGMTVEIDPDRPEWFTCAWIALPVRSVAFPLLMGQSHTPACLVDGTAYELGKKSSPSTPRCEAMEQAMYAEKVRLKEELESSIGAGNPEAPHVERLEQWSDTQARKLIDALKQPE
jgi:hypothetical protein